MSTPLNIIFAGTPDFAAKHLAALIESEHNVVAVYCPPDKPAGRGKKLTACATKELALEHNIEVVQPKNFKDVADQEQLASYQADVMVVVAYGLLLPEVILNTPRLGCINVHGSILPKWRGAAPIQRSVEAGDPQTGVTIMQMDKGLDTGAMIHKAYCDIEPTDTSASIYEKLAVLGPQALVDTLATMAEGKHTSEAQDDSLATYAHKLTKEEAELDWSMPSDVLERKVRAYIPWPVAFFTYTESEKKQHKIRIWQASTQDYKGDAPAGTIVKADGEGLLVATGEGAINLEVIQLPGKKALAFKDILNGRSHWFTPGSLVTGN